MRLRGDGFGVHAAGPAQLLGHHLRRRQPLRRPLGQRLANDAIDRRDDRGSAQGRRVFVDRGVDHVGDRLAAERRPAGEHLEEDRAGGEEIAAGIDGLTLDGLGRHVARRAHDHSGPRDVGGRAGRAVQLGTGQAEVEQLHAVRRQEHVRRFEVAMDDAARVQRRERGQNLEADRDRLGHVQRTASQLLRQRLTLEQLHGDEQAAGVFADLVNLTDVGMVDAGRRARFTPQPLARRLVAGERRASSSARPRARGVRRAPRTPHPCRPRRACA